MSLLKSNLPAQMQKLYKAFDVPSVHYQEPGKAWFLHGRIKPWNDIVKKSIEDNEARKEHIASLAAKGKYEEADIEEKMQQAREIKQEMWDWSQKYLPHVDRIPFSHSLTAFDTEGVAGLTAEESVAAHLDYIQRQMLSGNIDEKCVSLVGEEIGQAGLYIRGDMTMLSASDLMSRINKSTGERLFEPQNYTPPELPIKPIGGVGNMARSSTSIDGLKGEDYHEGFIRPKAILGAWAKEGADEEVVRAIKQSGLPFTWI